MRALVYFSSSNDAKQRDMAHFFRDLPGALGALRFDAPEILSSDLRAVVLAKAASAYQRFRVPLFVEHGGLYIDHLNGLPGPLAKPVWEALEGRLCGLIPEEQPRGARFVQMICYCDGRSRVVFEGRVEGTISQCATGEHGLHWHPVFIPAGERRTFAEMSVEERFAVSGVGDAPSALRRHLGL
jgi:XTP/dITP diphosphohydrolase